METRSNSKSFTIVQLYPQDMNIYGDWGNTLAILRRAEWHGYTPNIIDYNPGDEFPVSADVILGGGGQDSGQVAIQDDLHKIQPVLQACADNDVPMLMICGLYQLFGHFFKTKDGVTLPGIGILDVKTYGSTKRLIGNTVTQSNVFGTIVGYENHSGLTYLGDSAKPFAHVVKGAGNNGEDKTEGAVYRNVIGTYLHGSLLPKNPEIADWLIEKACIHAHGSFTPNVIDDQFAFEARSRAEKRPR
jgi:CobQ-like glutamine amidotransferase family enzyme